MFGLIATRGSRPGRGGTLCTRRVSGAESCFGFDTRQDEAFAALLAVKGLRAPGDEVIRCGNFFCGTTIRVTSDGRPVPAPDIPAAKLLLVLAGVGIVAAISRRQFS